MANKNDLRDLQKIAVQAGWLIEPTRGGHLRWKAPTGRVIFSASTPSDHKGVKNHTSLLRKAGLAC